MKLTFRKVNSVFDIQKGTKLLVCTGLDAPVCIYTVPLVANNADGETEVFLDTYDKYFNLNYYLQGRSWVKHVLIINVN